jgi:hypothetical protein
VVLFSGGTVTNGGATTTKALIEGGESGVTVIGGAAKVVNLGTVEAAYLYGNFSGVYLNGGGVVTNGSAADATALMTGEVGLRTSGASATTVTNFGVIRGLGGIALSFAAAGSVLNVEAGCAFQGLVKGGGGTLDLANGVGTLSSLTSAGDVTVSGSMATANFENFATLRIAAGATFTDTGVVSIGAGRSLIDAGVLKLGGGAASVVNAGLIETAGGSLTLFGTIENSGTLLVAGGSMSVDGAVTLGGRVTINGGTASFASTFSQNVAFTATGGTLAMARSQTYAGTISGFAKTPVSVLYLEDVVFTSGVTKASYSGTTAAGVLTVTDGTHTARIKLAGNYVGSVFAVAGDGHGGTKVTDPPPGPAAAFVAAMAAAPSAASPSSVRELWRGGVLTAPLVHAA